MRTRRNQILTLLLVSSFGLGAAPAAELRGIWMHGTQVKTPAEADALVARVDRAHLNAVFILVWYWGGQAFYRSDLCPMGEGVKPGYDPLGYMVEQCHRRGIQVHAWFVNGAYGASTPKHVLDAHPDWTVDDGGGGQLWYDFGKPEVRRFQSDLMLECLTKYDIDGIHFDYIRYGPQHCYCDHCQKEFARRYGFEPLTKKRRTTFPAAAGIAANPLAEPTTAAVLAELSDGTPAIALNRLGAGTVLLLNWHAENEMPPAVAETVRLTLGVWTASGAKVHVTTTTANRAEYGTRSLEQARTSLARVGYPSQMIDPERIADLPRKSVLVLPAVYIIGEKTADALEQFVRKGGNLLIIDGPVKSISVPAMQRVTGFAGNGRYTRRDDVIRSTGRSALVPKGDHEIEVAGWRRRMEKWAEFRMWGVTELVRDVYRRAKAAKPRAQVTAAIFSSFESAEAVYQDWPRWLREGTIDYVIPMAYTEDNARLARELAQYKSIDPSLVRIVPGLSIYRRRDGRAVPRDLDLVRSQRRLCQQHGTRGNVYFSLKYLSDGLVDVFSQEFYPHAAPAYVPPPRRRP